MKFAVEAGSGACYTWGAGLTEVRLLAKVGLLRLRNLEPAEVALEKGKSQMSVLVEFPEQVLDASNIDRRHFAQQVMIYTLGQMYHLGQVTAGFAAEVLGCSKIEFYRLLSENGFSLIDYPPDELGKEAAMPSEWPRYKRLP